MQALGNEMPDDRFLDPNQHFNYMEEIGYQEERQQAFSKPVKPALKPALGKAPTSSISSKPTGYKPATTGVKKPTVGTMKKF